MEATYGFSFRNICLYSCMCLPYWIKMCLFLPASHKNILALLASIWRGMKELVHEVWRNRKFLPKVVLLSFWPPGPCSDTNETSLVYYLKLNTPILLEKAKKKLKKVLHWGQEITVTMTLCFINGEFSFQVSFYIRAAGYVEHETLKRNYDMFKDCYFALL